MKKKEKILQIGLISFGLILILATYFLYPNIKEKQIAENTIKSEIQKDEINEDKKNLFQNVEYRGYYDLDKPFIIKSEEAHIKEENSDLVYMNYMTVTLYLDDGRVITITSDEGKYNKRTYDCFFKNNVKATDSEVLIQAENLDLIASSETASAYQDVYLKTNSGSMWADKVDYNFKTNYYKISMLNDEKIKIKLIN
tara:strand:+ start:191 stop:781 length:591 start_codon:yes stop_codon:yes gene_type:complete